MTSPYMVLVRTEEQFKDGCFMCLLKMFGGDDSLYGMWTVTTGQGWAQEFRKAGLNIPGSMEPLPQGDYVIHDILWAGGKDNWQESFGAGLGPVFIPIICAAEKRRGEFGIHMDYNRTRASSTAGCVGILTDKDMRDIVKLLRIYDPKVLYVKWGL